MNHAFRDAPHSLCSAVASLIAFRLTIRITDQGEGFEVQEVPDPLHDTNLLRHSGRGLFLMGAFMDDMKVRKVAPTGTEVTLVKNAGPKES